MPQKVSLMMDDFFVEFLLRLGRVGNFDAGDIGFAHAADDQDSAFFEFNRAGRLSIGRRGAGCCREADNTGCQQILELHGKPL